MAFNCDKFQCLRNWPGRTQVPDYQYPSPDGTPIIEREPLRDLGVEISCNLEFEEHIANPVTSASRMVGWAMMTMMTFSRRSRNTMLTIKRNGELGLQT